MKIKFTWQLSDPSKTTPTTFYIFINGRGGNQMPVSMDYTMHLITLIITQPSGTPCKCPRTQPRLLWHCLTGKELQEGYTTFFTIQYSSLISSVSTCWMLFWPLLVYTNIYIFFHKKSRHPCGNNKNHS